MTERVDGQSPGLSQADLADIADRVVKAIKPIAGLRAKKMLRPETAAELYDVSPDFLRRIPLVELPRVMQRRLTLYPSDALDTYFARRLQRH